MLSRTVTTFARSKVSSNRTNTSSRVSSRSTKLPTRTPRRVVAFSKSSHTNVVFQASTPTQALQTLRFSRLFSTSRSTYKMATSEKVYPNSLRFDLTAEEIAALPEKIIARSKASLDEIAATVASPSWSATMQKIFDEDAEFTSTAANCTFFGHVHEDKAVRDASTDAELVLDKYSIERAQRYDVYLAVKAYVENVMPTEKNLTEEQKYAIEKMMLDFKLSGMSLSEEERAKLKEIKTEIAERCTNFQKNVAEDKTTVEFTKEDLHGVSDTVLKSLKKSTVDESKYVVSMKYPELVPVMEQALNPKTREILSTANTRRLMKENVPLLEEVLELRKKQAEILGFESPAHHVLADKMAPSPKAVLDFLRDLTTRLEPAFVKELEEQLKLKQASCESYGYEFDGKVQAWDRAFTNQLILARDYAIDQEEIAKYFPMQHVVKATLEIYQELFGVKFELTENPHVWQADVVQYSVYDADTNAFIGHFYLDLHPRDGKYTHAAEFGLSKSSLSADGKRRHPVAAMVANFTKPTEESPSLLRHSEVVTWAHELGHVLHELLAASSYSPWSGTSTARDFVEAPSQALENWCFEPEALVRLSKHYQTGETLPPNLIDSLVRSKNANVATFNRRQLFFATFDMTLHSFTSKDAPSNTQELWKNLSIEITKAAPPTDSNGAATFGHIMGGYQACYYGYLWSEVFAADIFQQFKEKGIFNGKLGREYRRKVLAPGGSRSEMESLIDFLGREPNNEAFMEQMGLANKA